MEKTVIEEIAERCKRFPEVPVWQDFSLSTHNLLVGISCNRRVLNSLPDKIPYVLNRALQMTKGKIVIMIADALNFFNLQVFCKYNPEHCYEEMQQMGLEFHGYFSKQVNLLSQEQQSRILLVRWKEMETPRYESMLVTVRALIASHPEIRKAIEQIAKAVIHYRSPSMTPTPERIEYLCEYLTREIPTVALWDLEVKGVKLQGVLYPGFNSSAIQPLKDVILNLESHMNLDKSQKRHWLTLLELGEESEKN